MKTTLRTGLTVGGICEGFLYNEYEGNSELRAVQNKKRFSAASSA